MKEYGFVGAGKMAGAIVHGMLNSGLVKPSEIACACGNDDTGKKLSQATGISLFESVGELCMNSKVLVMACKPQQLAIAAESAGDARCGLVVSILAGTSIARLRQCFPHVKKIVRVMPNMPAQISEGISCYAPESELSPEELKVVDTILSAIGEYLKVDESQLDAVTALSGSGPGYIFEFAAAMIEGAKLMGFSEPEAKKLVDVQIARQRQLMEALSGSGASIGSHSLGYRVNRGMSAQDWARLSQLTGANIQGFGDVIKLDEDVIGKVLQDEKFVSVLTAVNSEFVTYIQNIDKYSEQLKEIAEQEKEAFTGVSFDEFRDSFVSMLSDLDATNQDFADNFEKYLQNAIFSSLIAGKYKQQIQELYDTWATKAESGGELTKDEAGILRNKYQDIINDMLAEREQIMKDFGWSSSADSGSSQSPSSGALTTMSQDSISTFEGIGRNMQTHLANTDKFVQEIRNTQKQDSQTLATIAGHTAHLVEIHEILSDMKLNGITLK